MDHYTHKRLGVLLFVFVEVTVTDSRTYILPLWLRAAQNEGRPNVILLHRRHSRMSTFSAGEENNRSFLSVFLHPFTGFHLENFSF